MADRREFVPGWKPPKDKPKARAITHEEARDVYLSLKGRQRSAGRAREILLSRHGWSPAAITIKRACAAEGWAKEAAEPQGMDEAEIEARVAATGDISANVQQSAEANRGVSENIVGITTASEKTGLSAEDVLAAAAKLSEQAKTLSDEVEHFLTAFRAA